VVFVCAYSGLLKEVIARPSTNSIDRKMGAGMKRVQIVRMGEASKIFQGGHR
jgi:hypothetical protein